MLPYFLQVSGSPSCASAAVYVCTSAVSYFPTSSLISHLLHFKCTFLLSHPHPFILSHFLILYWKSPTRLTVRHRYQAMQRRLGHMRGRHGSGSWPTTLEDVCICVFVCARVFLRVCELHTWVYNNKSPAACQPQGSSCSGPQIRGLQYTGCHYRVERWMDGCTDGSADHSPCCLILNYITINMNINYVNLKGYITSGFGSNGSPSGVGLVEYFTISASACWEFLSWTQFANLYSFEYTIRKLQHQKGGWAGNLSLPQKDTARARSNHFSMSWEHQKTWQSCLIRTLLPFSPSIM